MPAARASRRMAEVRAASRTTPWAADEAAHKPAICRLGGNPGSTAAVAAYAVLEGTEAVGLWLGRRWAEYLTFVATVIFVPYEIYELTKNVSALKVLALVINLAIVAYLLFAKRLFGLRGGGKAGGPSTRKTPAGRRSSAPPVPLARGRNGLADYGSRPAQPEPSGRPA